MVAHRSKSKEFLNRHVGRLVFDHTDLWLGPGSGPRMVTYVPADDTTRERVARLHAIARGSGSRGAEPRAMTDGGVHI
ncbi:hypothetical protein [Streptomyces fumanus]|uniref:hypothetical protein n=1 Tax=Streptomyces fumanus TaxID=67302 RepID=UPI003F4D2E52